MTKNLFRTEFINYAYFLRILIFIPVKESAALEFLFLDFFIRLSSCISKCIQSAAAVHYFQIVADFHVNYGNMLHFFPD